MIKHTRRNDQPAASQAPGGKPPRRRRAFLRLLLFALFGGALAVGVYYLLGRLTTPQEPGSGAGGQDSDVSVAGFDIIGDESGRVILRVDPIFTVNLRGLGGKRIMRVQIRLEVDSREVAKELNDQPAKYHRMVDEILRILKSKSYSDLVYAKGIERLKVELRQRLNLYIRRGKIVKVIFRDLLFGQLPDYPRRP